MEIRDANNSLVRRGNLHGVGGIPQPTRKHFSEQPFKIWALRITFLVSEIVLASKL